MFGAVWRINKNKNKINEVNVNLLNFVRAAQASFFFMVNSHTISNSDLFFIIMQHFCFGLWYRE